MLHIKIIDIKKEKIITSKAQEFIKSSAYGASIIFTGNVRNSNDDKEVTGITYDSHDKEYEKWWYVATGFQCYIEK